MSNVSLAYPQSGGGIYGGNLLTSSIRNRSSRSRNAATGLIGGAIGSLLETVWTEASYLILPAMMIEDANLVTGVKRATYIAKNNLLLITVSTVGVKWITGLISFVLSLIGLMIGVGAGIGIISVTVQAQQHHHWHCLGAILFFIFVMVASVISSYTMTAYNTCLFCGHAMWKKHRLKDDPCKLPHLPHWRRYWINITGDKRR